MQFTNNFEVLVGENAAGCRVVGGRRGIRFGLALDLARVLHYPVCGNVNIVVN